jgi:hypothetical protein
MSIINRTNTIDGPEKKPVYISKEPVRRTKISVTKYYIKNNYINNYYIIYQFQTEQQGQS